MIEDAKLTTALKSLAMCNPSVVVPLTGMDVRVDPTQSDVLRVTAGGFTVGAAFEAMRLYERAYVVACGALHVMLGHPGAMTRAMREGRDPATLALELQAQVEKIVDEAPRMPSGMFVKAAATTARTVIVQAPARGRAHTDIVELMLDARAEQGDVVSVSLTALGMPQSGGDRVDAMGWILRDQARSVETIDQGKSLLARLDTLMLTAVARSVALASILETILRTLKAAAGMKASEVSAAFRAEAQEACRDVFADGPLIRL